MKAQVVDRGFFFFSPLYLEQFVDNIECIPQVSLNIFSST